MFTLSESDILMGVLALLAGVAVALIVILKRRKWVAIRKRAFVVSGAAKEQGLELFAELCESVATGDIVEAIQELKNLETMFKTQGMLMAHLQKLFTKQLTLRLADPATAAEIFKAVDDARAAVASKNAAIVQAAKDAEALAAKAAAPA